MKYMTPKSRTIMSRGMKLLPPPRALRCDEHE